MKEQIRIGIIGNGSIAHLAHFPAFSAIPNVQIATLLSRDFDKAKASALRYGIPHVSHNIDEFLKQDLDAAVLLTVKTVRKEFLLPLLEAKLDILVEKPLATTLKECDYLANASAKSGQIVMVAFNRRFAPVNTQGIAAMNGQVPHLMVCSKSREFKEYRATLENAIHMVDMMRYVLGECVSVNVQARWSDNKFYEDVCTAQLSFDSGAIGMLNASRQAGQWYERIEMFGGNQTVIMECPDRLTIVKPDFEQVYNSTPLHKGCSNYVEALGYLGCDQHFIDCVRTRKTPMTSAEDAFKTHELMNQILSAAGLPDLSQKWD